MCGRIVFLTLFNYLIQNTAAAEKIPDVTVKAQKNKYPQQLPYFGQVITKEEVQRSGATHVTDLLNNKVGIQTRDSTGNGASFEASLRGFGSNAGSNTLVIVDGIKQNGYDLMPPSLSFLPVADIERIEIIPGSLGTLFGEAATGGIIEVVAQKPSKRSFNIRPYYGGPFITRGLGLTYADRLSQTAYRVGLHFDDSEGYRARNKRNQKSGQVALFFPVKNNALRFNYYATNEKIELPGALTEGEMQVDRRQAQHFHDFSQTFSHHLRGSYQASISEYWGLELVASTRQSKMHGILGGFSLNQARTLYSIEPKLVGNWPLPSGELTATAGVLGEGFNYTLKGFGTTKANEKTYAPYVRVTFPVVQKLALVAGTRWTGQPCRLKDSYATQATCRINPFLVKEVGLQYIPNQQVQLYLRRDENFRLPKVDEQTWIASNTKLLKPQRGISYETGARWMNVGSISLYHLIIHNEIDFDPLAISQAGFPGANRNLEPTVRDGAMLETRYPISKQAELSAHYTWTQARFKGGRPKGKKIPFVAEHVWGLSMNYTITPAWKAQIEYARTGKRYVMGDYENALPRLPGFGLLHATLSYHTKPWRFTLRAHNLTNVLYNEVAVLRFFYPAPERALTLNVEYAAE